MNLADGVAVHRLKLTVAAGSVVRNQRIGHRHDAVRTSTALIKACLLRIRMRAGKLHNAFGVGMLERVDRLILVAHDHEVAVGKKIDEVLLGAVKVLVFVHQQVVEHAAEW